jgi:RNA polymerase sigma-70 factor (ECF subfamily)
VKPEFADIYEEHVWQVYAFFAYRVRGRAAAEDLTQTTFERGLRAWDRFDPGKASPLTWLIAIARNLLIDYYRREGRTDTETGAGDAPEALHATEPGPEARYSASPELEWALEHLSEREREVLALRFGADLGGPEIAELLDMSLANVQQVTSRALRRMRSLLEETPLASARRAR